MTKETFEGWAIVELFGHNQISGLLSEAVIGGQSFVRVDVPATDDKEGFTKFFGGGAVYAITPTTEEIARLAASRLSVRPVDLWIVPVPDSTRQLPDQIVEGEDELMF